MHLEHRHVYDLFLLNLALQAFDGIATYQGMRLGWEEANPLLVTAFEHLGIGPALLVFKATACALLFMLHRNGNHPLVAPVLTLLAAVYALLSLVPWLAKYAVLLVQHLG